MTQSVYQDFNGPIAEIVLNRPQKRNALSIDMWAAIPPLIDQAENNKEIKVVILHGGDAGNFAAGADISEFAKIYNTPETTKASGETIAKALHAIENCSKPTISAIDGICVGGGVSLAMATDIRIASEDSKFGITPSKLGIVYPVGDTKRLLRAVGAATAKDLLFTARLIPAQEALDKKLIDRLATDQTALQSARALSHEISNVSQWSLRATKKMINGIMNEGWDSNSEEAEALFLEGFANEDYQDGHKAFLEKRPAKFTFK
ncbi:enoyl-CoA hydratase/isomerase family protein [Hirschia baltica]|uniref:Enoyl-CoA hydratase/isomerase n=1 Tax=Hirschia baltica (strain ATCC 49814 / DSM 5838 / IFAM 1418) TaxID=582402 RepID=C6XJ20_HIRBI|nr:enoyl-CoA hydratase/isomerase family protein [Hirschia baltica]ACT59115.1 Enoyl-CoA hydratase/isomerase [Hirschia baltica ATCC 49814]